MAVWAEAKESLTLEVILMILQASFIPGHLVGQRVQCGFCTPGCIMSATEILNAKREFSDDEIRKLMSGHLCRCTGYENILRAVKKTMLLKTWKK